MWPSGHGSEKAQGGINVATRNGKHALNAMIPAIPTPRLANDSQAFRLIKERYSSDNQNDNKKSHEVTADKKTKTDESFESFM
jgi:hypothetical protein